MLRKTFKVASTQISLHPLGSQEEFWGRIEALCAVAQQRQCRALLLPEYACLSLLTCGLRPGANFLQALQRFARTDAGAYEAQISHLAQQYQLHIVGGSYPIAIDREQIVNRCLVAGPEGERVWQDKIQMTRFEEEVWGIRPAPHAQLQIFTIDDCRCAVTICYDVEFPSITAAAAAAGVEVLWVPSCTDHVHGYWRVRHCAAARTVENQCFAVLASVVSGDPKFPEMDQHYGQAAILSPCDASFPERGILAEGAPQQEGLVVAELDRDLLQEIRTNGTVLNLRDTQRRSP